MRRTLLIALAFALSVGCADPFRAAQELDTVEAYESFLAENSSSPHRLAAEIRYEELSLEKVRAEPSVEAYDAFLLKFKDGRMIKQATEESRTYLFQWANETDTEAAWQKFLDSVTKGNRELRKKARKRLKMAKHKHRIEVGPIEQEQVNLAENPDGALDGWGFFTEVKNVGDEPISYLILRIDYLNAAGNVLDSDDQGACARYWNIPMPAEFYKPIMPGETRKWAWTTGDMPAGWSKKVRVRPVDIVVGIEEEEEE